MDAFEHPLKFSIQNHYQRIFYHEEMYTQHKELRETLCLRGQQPFIFFVHLFGSLKAEQLLLVTGLAGVPYGQGIDRMGLVLCLCSSESLVFFGFLNRQL